MRWLILALLCLSRLATAEAPKGYKCTPGYRSGTACKCPEDRRPARDADDKAICEPKPAPVATACLADRKGKFPIKVESTPVGATVYVGSKTCGVVAKTPWSGKVAAGPVLVILEHQSYDTVERTVTVTAKTTSELFVPMQRTNAGFVEIRGDSDPGVAGVEVTVDGQAKGPVPITIKVPVGRHLVEIAKPGFDNFSQWVDVLDGQTQVLLPVLKPQTVAKARLVIDADVKQAEVFVNGERKGTTPLALDDLPLGAYTIVVKAPGAKDWTQKLTLAAGQTLLKAELAASLPKLPTEAELDIVADQKDADVWIDGTLVGKAPLLRRVTGGDHWVQVKLAKHVTWETKQVFEAGKSVKLRATLKPSGEVVVTSTPAGATVFVDKVRRGLTPITLELAQGAYTIIVERAGYQRFEKKVQVSDKPSTVDAPLKR